MVKRLDLERHLRAYGCDTLREGAKHSVWTNKAAGRRSFLPRHRELPLTTARAICKQLGVPPLNAA